MSKFLDSTPYIQAGVVFISEPLSLAVALWGMTPPRTWRLFAPFFSRSNRDNSDDKM